MSAKHPARNVRQAVGAASVAAFVGGAIGIATGGGSNATQPANAATTPNTTNTAPGNSQFGQFGQDDGGWNATAPNDNGFQSGGGSFSGGGTPQSHTRSGGS